VDTRGQRHIEAGRRWGMNTLNDVVFDALTPAISTERIEQARERMRNQDSTIDAYRYASANLAADLAREMLPGISPDNVVFDEELYDPTPAYIPSTIATECRQWSDEDLQSVRTILIQESKRRKHEREGTV
jgi:hypothetical protein